MAILCIYECHQCGHELSCPHQYIQHFDDRIGRKYGEGSVGWSCYTFSVVTNTTGQEYHAWKLQRWLNALSPRTNPSIVVPSDHMFAGTVFIEITLCNAWGNCGKDYGELTMHEGVAPFADIVGATTVTMTRNEALLLKADIQPMMTYSNTTASGGLPAEMIYSYEVQDITSSTPLSVENVAVNSNYYLIGCLYSGVEFHLHCEAIRYISHGVERALIIIVHVIQPSILAQISGGSVITVSVSGTTTIDASTSYDPDEAPDSATGLRVGSHLGYVWVCAEDAYATLVLLPPPLLPALSLYLPPLVAVVEVGHASFQ